MLFRKTRRKKLARQLGQLAVPTYVESQYKTGAEMVLDRLMALHARLRAKAGLPMPEKSSLDNRIEDTTAGLMIITEILAISSRAREHVMAVRRPLGSPDNGDEALAEKFAQDVNQILERLHRYYDDVI